jgi:hypothetical protein
MIVAPVSADPYNSLPFITFFDLPSAIAASSFHGATSRAAASPREDPG